MIMIIKKVENNNADFFCLCEMLEKEHKNIIKEQRNKGANCLKNLEKYKTVLIAYEEEKPVGCIAMTEVQNEICNLGRVFVKESYRNRGIATKLLNEIEGYAKKEQAKILKLDTYERFVQAVHLYEKFGFKRIKNDKFDPNTAFSIYMEKKI